MIDRTGRIARHAVLIAFTLAALLPVYVMLSSSVRTQTISSTTRWDSRPTRRSRPTASP